MGGRDGRTCAVQSMARAATSLHNTRDRYQTNRHFISNIIEAALQGRLQSLGAPSDAILSAGRQGVAGHLASRVKSKARTRI